jgi:radical SAM-linked protein
MARKAPDREIIPVVQRVRLQYAKRGPLKFSSHRDFQRAFERAVRRIGVPMAYSAGFNPHPKISYANAAPTGTASEAEYVEIGLASPVDPAKLLLALQQSMPRGLDMVDAVVARTPDFVERLEASIWEIALPGADLAAVEQGVSVFLAADDIQVSRMTKNGLRTFDTRGAVLHLSVEGTQTTESGLVCVILRVVVRHLTPAVRPDDVLSGLSHVADLVFEVAPRITRIAQGPLAESGNAVSDPLGPDRHTVDHE